MTQLIEHLGHFYDWEDIEELLQLRTQVKDMEAERLRFYNPDGTFETLGSPEEVIERRVECAKQINDLAALVRSLIHQVNRFNEGNERAALALDYLKRKNLQGSPLR